MFLIRREQIEVLHQGVTRRFEDEMVVYLTDFSPRLSKILGETGLRRAIQMGVERADGYGFKNRGPTRFYLEMMFALGSYFDTDPQLPWAKRILTDKTIANEMSRADLLYDAMESYFEHVAGAENAHALRALRKIKQMRFDQYAATSGDFETRMLESMLVVYPEKCEYTGQSALREVIRRGLTAANASSITSQLGKSLLIGLMFGFGHGILADPLYPWAAETLNAALISDPNARAERLYEKTKIYIGHVLQHLA